MGVVMALRCFLLLLVSSILVLPYFTVSSNLNSFVDPNHTILDIKKIQDQNLEVPSPPACDIYAHLERNSAAVHEDRILIQQPPSDVLPGDHVRAQSEQQPPHLNSSSIRQCVAAVHEYAISIHQPPFDVPQGDLFRAQSEQPQLNGSSVHQHEIRTGDQPRSTAGEAAVSLRRGNRVRAEGEQQQTQLNHEIRGRRPSNPGADEPPPQESPPPRSPSPSDDASTIGDPPTVGDNAEHLEPGRGAAAAVELNPIQIIQPLLVHPGAGNAHQQIQQHHPSHSPQFIILQLVSHDSESTSHNHIHGSVSPVQFTSSSTGGSIRDHDHESSRGGDHRQPFMLGETVLSLAFQAAAALMILRLQTAAPSASSSSNSNSPAPPISISFDVVGAALAISFLCTMAAIFLRDAHRSAARIGEYTGLLSAAFAFLAMAEMFLPASFSWILWPAGVFLFLAYLYALSKMMR